LLVRDEETIVVTPNTVISLPGEATESGLTRILQQAGSIVVGEVEVADYNSGEVASIKQGQAARSQGERGLILPGTGIFNLIRKGEPIKAVLELIKVPKNGLRAPLRKAGQVVRTVRNQLGRSLNTDAGRCIGTTHDRRVAASSTPRTPVSLRAVPPASFSPTPEFPCFSVAV
jgi:hypothetical protein